METQLPKSQAFANSRYSIINIILISNVLVWYFLINSLLKDAVTVLNVDFYSNLLIWSAHYGGILLSAIVGAKIAHKIQSRNKFLIWWMILGVIASIAWLIVDKTNITGVCATALLFGVSLGIGMPSCMGYFTANTRIERRGSVGGIVLLLSGVAMFGLGLATSGDWFIQVLLLIVWRLGGLGFFVILKTDDENLRQKRTLPPVAYRALFSQKQFLLYLIPWLMFSLITFLTIPIQASMVGQSEVDLMTIIESALGGVFSLLGGFLADRVGRKRIAIVGFVMLGLGYSVLGISAELTSWYFYTVVDGIAWGLLYVLFVITIWGDLSNNSSAEKYYAIGVAPFFASKFLQLTMSNNISAAIMPAAIFSFTAFFLFVAVLPLIYAPETLPEKVLQDRDLKSYVEKAKKKAAKESQTVSKPEEQKEAPPADSDEDAEYEEACKLAEKYY